MLGSCWQLVMESATLSLKGSVWEQHLYYGECRYYMAFVAVYINEDVEVG